jgi:CheY-like chemotaxis protein
MNHRVLVIDDDPDATKAMRRVLELHDYIVQEENDATRALATARAFRPDAVILDYRMPVAHGGDVAWQLSSDPELQHVRLVVCSGVNRAEFARSLPPRPIPILEKPVSSEALLAVLSEG